MKLVKWSSDWDLPVDQPVTVYILHETVPRGHVTRLGKAKLQGSHHVFGGLSLQKQACTWEIRTRVCAYCQPMPYRMLQLKKSSAARVLSSAIKIDLLAPQKRKPNRLPTSHFQVQICFSFPGRVYLVYILGDHNLAI